MYEADAVPITRDVTVSNLPAQHDGMAKQRGGKPLTSVVYLALNAPV